MDLTAAVLDSVVLCVRRAQPAGEGAKESSEGAIVALGHRPGHGGLCAGLDVGAADRILQVRGRASCVDGPGTARGDAGVGRSARAGEAVAL